jgi:hypothetical protein
MWLAGMVIFLYGIAIGAGLTVLFLKKEVKEKEKKLKLGHQDKSLDNNLNPNSILEKMVAPSLKTLHMRNL